MLEVIERICNILATPKDEWEVVEEESTTIGKLYTRYIIPLAAIDPIASFIGLVYVGVGGMYRKPVPVALVTVAISYIVTLIGVFVVSLVINALAPVFNGKRDQIQALKLTAYAYTPAWLAAILYAMPSAGLVAMLGSLYGIYLLNLGLPRLMKIPKDKTVIYTMVVAFCAICIGIVPLALPKINFAMPTISIQWGSPSSEGSSGAAQQQRAAPPRQKNPSPSRQTAPHRHALPPDTPPDVPVEAPPPLR